MGNKRGRAPRNKKSNNWNVIRKIKKAKKDAFNNQEPGEQDTLPVSEPSTAQDQTICDESDDDQESPNNSIKRRKMSNDEEHTITVPEISENFYALLRDDDNDGVDNGDTQEVDPLATILSDEEDIEDDNDEVHDEEEVSDGNEDEIDRDEDRANREDSNLSSDEDDEAREELILGGNVTGTRLFEVDHLFKEIRRIDKHSKNCSFDDMVVIGETKRGFNSIFKFQCKKCGTKRKLESSPKKRNHLNCNEKAVLGITSIGSGFYHLEELFTQLDVPCMGNTLYSKISKDQQADWISLAKEKASQALQEEIELAIAAGDVDSAGNALIAVISDGSWGKRSYGKKFNSLSGCAVLIGVRTKKVVFYGVRNKYCHICKIAQSKNTPVRNHECNINYRGPSSGMEADIILEGFRESNHVGARYHKFIADGDSNSYKILRDSRIYKNPDLFIEKIECINHLCRNFRSKFAFLQSITKFDVTLRKHVKPSKGNDICKGIKAAANYWRESKLSLSKKISNLEQDIMNAPSHYLGVHSKCRSYFCTKTTSRAAIDNLKLLKEDGLFYEISNLCQVYFAGNAKSLLENQTNNPAEEFNNIVAKYLGGKRICYSLAASYSARVACAVIHHNTEGQSGTAFRKYKLGDDHQSSTAKLEGKRKRKLVANEVALATKPRLRHVAKEDTASAAYVHGFGSEGLDKSPDELEKLKKNHLKKLKSRQQNRKNVEKQTHDKKFDSYWQTIRQDLIPSSHFHSIMKATTKKRYVTILEEIMYNRTEFGNSAQIKHQRLVERDALQLFENLYGEENVKECGIFIDKELAFLGSSPLRLYGKNHVVNIKCPAQLYNKKFDDVIGKMKFFKITGGDVTLNENSDWYIELQSEMHITNRTHAFIVIWLGESNYRIIEVPKKALFFEENLKEKLTYFYMEVMIKELVDSRVGRRMPLRQYDAEKSSFV